MQWDNLTLVRKWHEYVGPKDERLEVEEAKVYKTGFMLLSIGTLVLLIYQLMAQQVAWIHKDDGASYDMFANPVEAAMYIWFVVVMVACAIMQARKGYVDTNRFGQNRKVPCAIFCAHLRAVRIGKRCRHLCYAHCCRNTVCAF